jgi:hypothetical protein
MFKENCGTYITSAGIGGTTIYQSDMTRVTGYDLATADQVFYVQIPGASYIGGVVADTSGNIYVPDMPSRAGVGSVDMIYKIRLSDSAISEFVNTDAGLGFMPRDIVFDPVENRLVVTFMDEPVYIQAVSLADSTVTNLVRFETDYTNGIARDQFGYIYVAGYDIDTIFRYPPDFSLPAEIVSVGHDGPCNIDYNPRDHILAVPNYFGSTVDFVRVGRPELLLVTFSDVAGGNGDGVFEAGESIELIVTVFNTHLLPLTDLSIDLVSVTGGLVMVQSSEDFGSVPARAEVTNSNSPFVYDIPAEYEAQVDTFYLEMNYASDYGMETDTVLFFASMFDADLDRIPDGDDNCIVVANVDQADTDSDGIGDACDECTDSDADLLGDPGFAANTCPDDNCPYVFNPYDQSDDDGDGSGNVCDVCPGFDDNVDSDSDGWADGCDNCPDEYNPGQEDIDENGVGDICEGCCEGRVGDANGLGGDEPTIGDASVVIDAKFITGSCDGILDCLTEADVNRSGGTNPSCDGITIGDISTLIDYLFITGSQLGLAECL